MRHAGGPPVPGDLVLHAGRRYSLGHKVQLLSQGKNDKYMQGAHL